MDVSSCVHADAGRVWVVWVIDRWCTRVVVVEKSTRDLCV